ncbi:proline dehydrogenase family protein [Escherichia coli]
MIRLVKGAYWDSEIKRAQMDGLEGYPVYTRKVYTNVAISPVRKSCWRCNLIYPQIRDADAHTLAAIYQLAGQNYSPGQSGSSACMVWASHSPSRSPESCRQQT